MTIYGHENQDMSIYGHKTMACPKMVDKKPATPREKHRLFRVTFTRSGPIGINEMFYVVPVLPVFSYLFFYFSCLFSYL